ncbi:protein TIFY 10a-like [Musa acuminata AAA Group]|uniref:protein TIFY 10a-like n=1 Tax=Musa acuminata AAA Group TaxID=214697 RepID=UPI0031D8056B
MEKGGERLVGRSHFSLTCRLLSQYLKKNGSFGDLGLLLAPRPIDHQAKGNFWVPNTICFKPGNEVSGMDHHHADKSTDKNASNSLELMVSQHSISLNSSAIPRTEESTKPSDAKEIGKDQLTIFYGGQILVFDNFPADKAKDLLLMASKESIADPAADCTSNEPAVALQSSLPEPGQANSSDMPIARRNSLNRFLGKRKDRMGQAPYQVPGGSAGPAAAKPAENQPWLSLGPKPESSSQSSR